jgi:hypothetical protein
MIVSPSHYFRTAGICVALFVSFFAFGDDLDSIDGPLLSPDGTLEVYKLPEGTSKDVNGNDLPYGTKLFVRRRGSSRPGILLLENARWMAAQWAPRSNLLGVENHWDGHASQVYVYELSVKGGSQPVEPKLVFRSPDNGYDVKWFIEGWDVSHRIIRLRKDAYVHPKDGSGQEDFSENRGSTSLHHSFVIGTKPLPRE